MSFARGRRLFVGSVDNQFSQGDAKITIQIRGPASRPSHWIGFEATSVLGFRTYLRPAQSAQTHGRPPTASSVPGPFLSLSTGTLQVSRGALQEMRDDLEATVLPRPGPLSGTP